MQAQSFYLDIQLFVVMVTLFTTLSTENNRNRIRNTKLFNMTPILLIAVMIIYTFDTCSGAIDTGVTVFGTTVGPNYNRPEGIRT